MAPTTAQQAPSDVDLLVVGGGIVGLSVARELVRRHPGRSLCVLEREPDVGFHQTGHNSGVVHAGIYYKPGSLKARLCVAGAGRLYEYCEARGVPVRRNGKLIVALDESELPRLDELERRGAANGVPGLRRLGAQELREIEPHDPAADDEQIAIRWVCTVAFHAAGHRSSALELCPAFSAHVRRARRPTCAGPPETGARAG